MAENWVDKLVRHLVEKLEMLMVARKDEMMAAETAHTRVAHWADQ